MSKTITRKYIQRITKREGNTSIRQSGSGGGGGGGASQYWVEENYVSKLFFNRLFTVLDEDGNPIEPNDTETVIESIQSMFGFWTNAYLSALGQNPEGGEVALTLASLADVDVSTVSNGDALVWNAALRKWVPGQGGMDLTAMWAALGSSSAHQIDASHLSTALAGYATQTWVGQQGYITASALNGYATESWVGTQISDMATQTWVGNNYLSQTDAATTYLSKTDAANTYLSIAFFARLFRAYNGSTAVNPNDTTSTIDNIKAMFGFWTEQYISALGNSGGGSAYVTMDQVWTALGNATNEQINISHLTTALSGYATTTALASYNPTNNFKTINGYSIIGTGNITIESSGGTVTAVKVGSTSYSPTDGVVSLPDYLKLSGGAMSNTNLVTNLNADLLDGYQAKQLPLITTESGTNIESNTDLNDILDAGTYYCQAGNVASTLSNTPYTGGNFRLWHIVNTGNDGDGSGQWSSQIFLAPNSGLMFIRSHNRNVFGTWKEFAYLSSNVASATKLQTARTIWGQNFDGTENVTGTLSSVSGIKFSSNGHFEIDDYGNFQATTDTDSNYWNVYRYDGSSALVVKASSGNVGVATKSPSYKLHVNGTFYASGNSSIGGTLGVTGATTLSGTLSVLNAATLSSTLGVSGLLTASGGITIPSGKTLTIGDAVLSWDSTNQGIKITKGLYSETFISALGQGSSGGSGVDMNTVWTALGNNTNEQINATHLSTALSGYATQSWVQQQLTGGTVTAVKVGTTTYNPSSGIVSLPDYLPLSGGTMTGSLSTKHPFRIYNGNSTTKASSYLRFIRNGADGDDYAALGWNGDNVRLAVQGGTGNYESEVTILNVGYNGQLKLQAQNGISPITTSSTTLVSNLNADMLDGQHGSYYATASSLSNYLPLTAGTSNPLTGILFIKRTNTAELYFGQTTTTNGCGVLTQYETDGRIGLHFFANDNILTLLTSGNVGIGTTSPSYKLHVAGTFYASENSSIGGTLSVNGVATIQSYIDIDRTVYGSLPLGTQLGILRARSKNAETGTYGYNAVISTFGSGETGTTINNFPVRIGSMSGATVISAGESAKTFPSQNTDICNTENLYLEADGSIAMYTGVANDSTNYSSKLAMFINTSCNVGIGTSSPSYKLDVNGTGNFEGKVRISSAHNANLLITNTGNARWMRNIQILSPNITAGNESCIAIGYADSKYNQAQISFRMQDSGSESNCFGIGFHSNDNIFNILAGGNVGIGTTNPSYKLSVSGDVSATNFRGNFVGNADSATKLQTARTIWGQSFDGTGNVSGAISGATTISASSNVSVGGTLGVTGATTLSSTLGVTGATTMSGTLTMNKSNIELVNTSTNNGIWVELKGVSEDFALCIGDGNTNRGIIDFKRSKWMIYFDASNTYCEYGNFVCSGGVTALSDARHKRIVSNTDITIEQIARMSSVRFLWSDDRNDDAIHVGSIAQDWQSILPEVVIRKDDKDGTLSLNYGVAALVSVITTARKVVDHERRIKELEKENERLRFEVEQLKIA